MFQSNKVGFGVILILAFVFCVDTQICTKKITSMTWVYETYNRTFRESYHVRCIYRCSNIRYRSVQRPYKVAVPKYSVEEIKVCCSGYKRDETLSYLQCLPICNNTCGHGTCIAPNVCECDIGYRFDNHTCQPICTNTECGGSSSVSPNIKECKTGYKISSNGTCVPICSNGCLHGTCVAPENCTCNDRWHKNETGQCIPFCDIDCGEGGRCVEPDVCECLSGYEKNENGTCIPHCSSGCPNGTCIRPDVCQCDTGYKMNVDNVYSRICIPECKNCNGTCFAPGKCMNFLEPQSTTVDMTTDCYHGSCAIKDNSTTSKTDTKNYITTTIKVTSEATNSNNDDKIYSDKIYIQNNWSSDWTYVALTIVAVTLVAVSFLIMKRKAVASVFTKRSYVVKENQAFIDCQSV